MSFHFSVCASSHCALPGHLSLALPLTAGGSGNMWMEAGRQPCELTLPVLLFLCNIYHHLTFQDFFLSFVFILSAIRTQPWKGGDFGGTSSTELSG